MNTKTILATLFVLTLGLFISCSDDEKTTEYVVTIASVKIDAQFIEEPMPYYVKYEGDKDWKMHWDIQGFEHTEGSEYLIEIERVPRKGDVPPGYSEYDYYFIREISKTKKDSENLPN